MVNTPPPFGATAPSTSAVVVVVAPFEENAKRIESCLRNAGHRVRTIWISDAGDLDQQLRKSPPDVLLASNHASSVPLKLVIDTCRRFAPLVPVLALTSQLAGETASEAVAAGARDLVADGDPESLAHLEKVYLRELQAQRNLHALSRAHTQLADYESRYAQLIDGTGDAVAHIFEGIVSKANPAFSQLLGYDNAADLAGMPLMDLICPEHHTSARDHLKQLNNGRADGKPFECHLLGKAGNSIPIRAQLTRGESDGERFVEMLIRAESSKSGTSVAQSGRIEFFKQLESPPRTALPRAVVFVVIDKSPLLEERVGFLDFEQIMLQVIDSLRKMIGESDALFRFSTSEFSLLLERPDAADFEKIATALVQTLGSQIFSTRDHESQLSLSGTVYPLGANDAPIQVCRDLVHEARRLSAAGGNKHVVLGPTARADAEDKDQQRRADAVRKALEEGRFKLTYQTIASLEGDPRPHYDVLIRMINDQGVEVHAGDFISVAERAGLMEDIDRWVVTRALKVMTSRQTHKDGTMLFVKLSESTLKQSEAFLAWLQDSLKGRRLNQDEICFELQESVLQNHIRKAKLLTKSLRELGAGVAIEHFGVGASSAQLMEHLPINFFKFHMNYTHDFSEKDVQKKMLDYMELAKKHNIKAIVCHVEDANVMAQLWQMGVNFVQGYHVQEPEVVMLT